MDEFFYRLTPHQILQAVESVGLEPSGHCLQLNSFENRVFDIRLENGSHIIAKFYRPLRWSREQIAEEHEFLSELTAAEIPVCAPLIFPDGSTIQDSNGIFFGIWPRTGGRAPDEFDRQSWQELGRFLGRLHSVGSEKKFKHRPELSLKSHVREPLEVLSDFIPERFLQRYCNSAHAIAERYQNLAQDVKPIRIHGDCHPGNLLRDAEGNWFFLDFDDTMMGPPMQDFWMLLPRAQDPEAQIAWQHFQSGYLQFSALGPVTPRWFEILRGLRFIYYAGWIARRWEDPAFPQAFPHFGTESYWEKETSDLEEQLVLIESLCFEGLLQKAGTEEKLMSNKEYFYDYEE